MRFKRTGRCSAWISSDTSSLLEPCPWCYPHGDNDDFRCPGNTIAFHLQTPSVQNLGSMAMLQDQSITKQWKRGRGLAYQLTLSAFSADTVLVPLKITISKFPFKIDLSSCKQHVRFQKFKKKGRRAYFVQVDEMLPDFSSPGTSSRHSGVHGTRSI